MEFRSAPAPEDNDKKGRTAVAGFLFLSFFFLILTFSFFSEFSYVYILAFVLALLFLGFFISMEAAALSVLIFISYFETSPVSILAKSVPPLLPGLLILYCIVRGFKRSTEPIVKIRIRYFGFLKKFLFLLLFFFVMSSMNAEEPLKTFLLGLSLPIVSLFLASVYDYLKDFERLEKFMRHFCIVSACITLYGVMQSVVVRLQMFLFLEPFIVPLIWQNKAVQFGWKTDDFAQFYCRSIFGHQNNFGVFLASVAPIVLVMFFLYKKKWQKGFYGSIFLLMGLAAFLTRSRGGMLNMMIGCGVVLLIVRPKHLWKLVGLGTAGVGAFIFLYWEKIVMLFRLKSGLSGRGQIWAYAWDMVQRSPWLGVGFQNVGREFYSRYGPAYIVDMQLFFDNIMYVEDKIKFDSFLAHNLFLNFAAEMGIFAGITVFFFYVYLLFRTFHFLQREKLNRYERFITIAMLGVFAGSFVHSFIDHVTLRFIIFQVVIMMAVERIYIIRLIEREDREERKTGIHN